MVLQRNDSFGQNGVFPTALFGSRLKGRLRLGESCDGRMRVVRPWKAEREREAPLQNRFRE